MLLHKNFLILTSVIAAIQKYFYMVYKTVYHVQQMRHIRHFIYSVMKLSIRVKEKIVFRRPPFHFFQYVRNFIIFFFRSKVHGFRCKHALQLDTKLINVLNFPVGGKRRDNGPLVGQVLNETGTIKAHERFTYGASPYSKPFLKVCQNQSGTGEKFSLKNKLTDKVIGLN